MSFVIRDRQVEAYNAVKGYSDDEVYRRVLEKAYRCLKKAVVTSIAFLFIGVALSIYVSGFLYRIYDNKLPWVLSLVLSLAVTTFVTLLTSLFGVFIAENYMDRNELEFLNGIFKDHAVCSECDNCKVTINSNGVFFSMNDGTLFKISELAPESVKVVSKEYYEMNYACVMRKVKTYSVYDGSGKLLGCKGEVQ